ncbi:MAG: polyamine aminopropyltransferase [Alphaproteobacteria bacterium]|nr:polyamine aminopropyltransferase [Alphaproteobacteria bacterium]
MASSPEAADPARRLVLLASVFAVAVAGLVYELVAGTLSTYLLGGSVTVFSLVIGLFLSAMGGGAWLAQYVDDGLERTFVLAELALAAVGGSSALVLFAAFAWLGGGYVVAVAVVCVLTGALVGLEIPLLLRILERRTEVRVAVSQVLALDYVGALAGSVAFPLLLLPHLGLVRAAAFVGLLNAAVAGWALHALRDRVPQRGSLAAGTVLVAGLLGGLMVGGGGLTTWIEDQLYDDHVILARQTPYQRIVVTRWRDDVRLFLDGHLQLSTRDEYRYHEALVHPAMAAARAPVRVLVLGGGDGLGVQRVLLHPGVREVDLVDLDPAVVELFSGDGPLAEVSGHALDDPRVTIHATDAVRFLEKSERQWDVVIMDLPDPHDPALARLYARTTFRLALQRLADDGALVTQATSPFHAPEAYWCIVQTLEAAAADLPVPRRVHPGFVEVPSFGTWGVALAAPLDVDPGAREVVVPTRFLDATALRTMWQLPGDLSRREVEVNTLGTAVLARYYRRGWMGWQ